MMRNLWNDMLHLRFFKMQTYCFRMYQVILNHHSQDFETRFILKRTGISTFQASRAFFWGDEWLCFRWDAENHHHHHQQQQQQQKNTNSEVPLPQPLHFTDQLTTNDAGCWLPWGQAVDPCLAPTCGSCWPGRWGAFLVSFRPPRAFCHQFRQFQSFELLKDFHRNLLPWCIFTAIFSPHCLLKLGGYRSFSYQPGDAPDHRDPVTMNHHEPTNRWSPTSLIKSQHLSWAWNLSCFRLAFCKNSKPKLASLNLEELFFFLA